MNNKLKIVTDSKDQAYSLSTRFFGQDFLWRERQMNEILKKTAKDYLKEMLAKLPESNQRLFKQMYAKGKMDLGINEVVDNMDEEKMDWAMQQVENTLDKQATKQA